MHHLHRAILKRIVLAWLCVSSLFLVVAFVLGVRALDKLASDTALSVVHRTIMRGTEPSGPPPSTADQAQKRIPLSLEANCLAIRVYDRKGGLISEAANPAFPGAISRAEGRLRDFPRDGRPYFHRFDLDQKPLVQWLVPLKSREIPEAGFIEGIMFLDENALQMLKRSLRFQAFIVLGSIAAVALALYPLMLSLNRRVIRFADEVANSHIEIVSVLSAAVAQRDSGTSDHNFRATLYAIRLAEAIGTERIDMRVLIFGAFLHDVGKIGIRDAILLKNGRLTEDESAIMRTHVRQGVDIVSRSRWLLPAVDVVQFHHERYDGVGYPHGLSGEDIPLEARIFAVVDVFDALTSRRSYKEPVALESAMSVLEENAGTQLDPAVVAVFLTIAPRLHADIHALSEADLMSRLLQATDRYRPLLLAEDWKEAFAGRPGRPHPFPQRT